MSKADAVSTAGADARQDDTYTASAVLLDLEPFIRDMKLAASLASIRTSNTSFLSRTDDTLTVDAHEQELNDFTVYQARDRADELLKTYEACWVKARAANKAVKR